MKQYITQIEQAQSDIRIIIKNYAFLMKSKRELDKEVIHIIRETINKIDIPDLQRAVYASLMAFYRTEYRIISALSLENIIIFLAVMKLNKPKEKNLYTEYLTTYEVVEKFKTTDAFKKSPLGADFYQSNGDDNIIIYGVPNNIYWKDYVEKQIKPIMARMAKVDAQDIEGTYRTGHKISLRARAELEARYQYHVQQINELKDKGVKVVDVSSHTDCSDRCAPWQNRCYSLDGTSGTTKDGRNYIPLEVATNILTPNGKWYNGLFGFNCRHYMQAHKDGFRLPEVTEEERKKQYAITQRQRAMERNVLHWKKKAEMFKDIDKVAYRKAKRKAQQWESAYIDYSKRNKRAYYPYRIKLL